MLKNAQSGMDHSIIGFVIKMDEGVAAFHWRQYFSSLATVSTNTPPNPVSPVIKWPDYSEIKQIYTSSSYDNDEISYYTRPFYTHPNGYKMQLLVIMIFHGNNKLDINAFNGALIL